MAASLSGAAAAPVPGAAAADTAAPVDERPESGRTLAEPLAPVGTPAGGETHDLAMAIGAYRATADVEAVRPILAFLDRYPAFRGRGASADPNPGATTPSDPMKPGDCGGGISGMPRYNFHVAVVSLNVTDAPVGYAPPRGPAMAMGITYNSREDFQPATFTFTNLGSRWSFNWLSYVEDDDPNNAGQTIRLAEPGGGSYILPHLSGTGTGTYGPNVRGQHETVVRTLQNGVTAGFVRTYPNGAQDIYSLSDNAATMRKYFLTEVSDPAGNTVTLTYDAAASRLLSIADPLGQRTTLTYGFPGDIYKITAVTDPFGRHASFQYSGGEIQSVTDAVGMTSSFTYGPASDDGTLATDFMSSMTTPYGTTAFETGDVADPANVGDTRWLVATDPLGNSERIEFIHAAAGISLSTAQPVPAGFPNQLLEFRNTFYWNQSAMQQYSAADPNRYLNATYLFHWLHDGTGSVVAASSIPDGHYVLDREGLVTLRFARIGDLRIDGFNHQNVLWSLQLTRVNPESGAAGRWRVAFNGTFGMHAEFACDSIEVCTLEPL
jgi:YD repeat-containing protein